MKKAPELLCPAGSPDAFDAAIEGGADAVYFGGTAFNARMNAKNFGGDDLRSAVLRAHSYGVKAYLTLNTLVTDRELPAFVDAAAEAARAGVDALIVADPGGAAAIRRCIPSLELHASTQMSGHNAGMGKLLAGLGYSRMVVARETSATDLAEVVKNSPIEIELFIHGALCVSHSGQCLFSSVVGGRSGNRGECAQPCRLPYSCGNCRGAGAGKTDYPLSFKDLSLAGHIPEILSLGVASLKIEGRMKSPEYVRDTARIYRRLLDEERAATPAELRELAGIFSRGGFTDGYFTGKINSSMLGVRSEGDKDNSRTLAPFTGLTKKIPLRVAAKILPGEAISMTLSDGCRSVTVTGDAPLSAINAPLTKESAEKNLCRFGGTPFTAGSFELSLGAGVMLPVSRLNDLRRRAVAAWQEGQTPAGEPDCTPLRAPEQPEQTRKPLRSARFQSAAQIPDGAKDFFDRIYLPLTGRDFSADGVVLPPVIFDRDTKEIAGMLREAADAGVRYALIGNLGHLKLATDAGLIPVGDFRLNCTNSESVRLMERLGFDGLILSPELTLPQIRDLGGNTSVIVYGRLPLMTLEKCVSRDVAGCDACRDGNVTLRDRVGAEFPVLREWQHRSVVCNSLPTSMSDRPADLAHAGITAQHFLFTTESNEDVSAVLRAFSDHTPLPFPVRRIK